MNSNSIGLPADIVFQCEFCSKLRPTKRSLFNHMRNVHRVREATCSVCGKVFRTPALLQKHMMYHDETKRIHRCPYCPDKPGWFTNVALKRHQKSHHLGLKEHHCDAEYCDASFRWVEILKQTFPYLKTSPQQHERHDEATQSQCSRLSTLICQHFHVNFKSNFITSEFYLAWIKNYLHKHLKT